MNMCSLVVNQRVGGRGVVSGRLLRKQKRKDAGFGVNAIEVYQMTSITRFLEWVVSYQRMLRCARCAEKRIAMQVNRRKIVGHGSWMAL